MVERTADRVARCVRSGLRAGGTVCLVVGFALVAVLGGVGSPAGADEHGPVYVIDISGTIDLGLAPYLDRVLGDARDAGASAVILEIDTPGGRLDAVLQMRDALLDSPLRTIALIDSTAFSAGALVVLASEEIYFTPGGVMGAATPVVGNTGEVADEKTVSAVRATFEATATERGRDAQVAAAMVDTEVAIDGLVPRGRLLTLTVAQAVEVGYADGVVDDRAALLDELGLGDRELIETSLTLAERLVRFITNPVLASLLLTVGMLALIADLLSGGVGLGVAVGAGLLGLFFWGHMLAGLAGWEDVALVVLGLGLIALEVFVVPGFGVPGVLGFAALLGGAFLATISRDFDFVTQDDLLRAGLTVGVAFVATVIGLGVALSVLSRRGTGSALVLSARLGVTAPVTERAQGGWLRWFDAGARLPQDDRPQPRRPAVAGESATAAPEPAGDAGRSLQGATGVASSDLRPSGTADIDGRRVDVVTEGDFLGQGEPVEVVRDDGWRRVVRRRPL